jgi:UDP-N-acetylmuramate--alanine ligase
MELPAKVYMVGIGGIGMSALAQLLKTQGKEVIGSDREESPVIAMLTGMGIPVVIGHDGCNIPSGVELLVYSDAIPETNAERARAAEMGIPELSYFEALAAATEEGRTIAVAGTHGKTTTTGMLAKILQSCDKQPTAIVGSIVRDFGSNYLPGREDLFVVEACEYRDHLLKLSPDILVITNIELDHTDYFPNIDALIETFKTAAERVPADGFIIADPAGMNIASALTGAQARIVDYTQETVPALEMIGEFNHMNARAAKAAARAAFPHLQEEYIDRALLDFKGSWRRFEYKGETPDGALVYDDYAHHPTAIEMTIQGVREKFPGERIVIAFHPHLYSRTKSLMNEFAKALAKADRALIAPIYAAREKLDPEVSSEILAAKAKENGGDATAYGSFDDIREELLKEGRGALIITMGAGDIYKIAEQIAD